MQKTKSVALILGVLAMSFLVGYLAFAWTEPTASPPGGNVPAPLNVGNVAQTKTGSLRLGGLMVDGSALLGLTAGYNVGIGMTSPAYKLDITGDVRWTGTLQGGSVPWVRLTSFPSDCPSGQYVYGVGGTLKCSAPAGGTGGIGGSGTTNYVAKFTAGTTIGNSQIYDNGANIGIGTASPTQKLDVAGYVKGQSGLCIGNDCRSNWPIGGGSGDITDVLGGTGISVANSAGPQPTVSVKNNAFICGAANQGLKSINIDTGAVTCETDDVGSGVPYPSKSCGAGTAIQSFNVNSSAISCVAISAISCVQVVSLNSGDGQFYSPYCPSGYMLTGGGLFGGNTMADMWASAPSGQRWVCGFDGPQVNTSSWCYAVCCRI